LKTASTLLAAVCYVACFVACAASATSNPDSSSADSLRTASVRADTASVEPDAIMYYFHRTLRCQTCLTIEAYIDEALRVHFAEALEDGRLLWRPTNIEEPENGHFEEEFDLEFNSAILVRLEGGKIVSWANLESVWDLIDTKEGFLDYIRENVEPVLTRDSGDVPPQE